MNVFNIPENDTEIDTDQIANEFEQCAIEIDNSVVERVPIQDRLPEDYFIPSHTFQKKASRLKVYHPRDGHHIPKKLKTIIDDVENVEHVIDLQNEEGYSYEDNINNNDDDDDDDVIVDESTVLSGEPMKEQITIGEYMLNQLERDCSGMPHYFTCCDENFIEFVEWITDENFGVIQDAEFTYFRSRVWNILGPILTEKIKWDPEEYKIALIPSDNSDYYKQPMKCAACGHIRKAEYMLTGKNLPFYVLGHHCGEIYDKTKDVVDYINELKQSRAEEDMDPWKIECSVYLELFLELRKKVDTLYSIYCK